MCKELELTPENALQRLPEAFYGAFAGELVSVFGVDIFMPSEDGESPLFYLSGSNGWNLALKMTCKKLGEEWFYEWYDRLEWYDSDAFDSVLEDRLLEFSKLGVQSVSPYYTWLVKGG